MFGIDISHHNGVIDFAKLKDRGVEFVYIKATEGTKFTDPNMKDNSQKCEYYGIPYGFYHYFRNDRDGADQFKYFWSKIPHSGLLPYCDIEHEYYINSALPNRVKSFYDQASHTLLTMPGTYTRAEYWERVLKFTPWVIGSPLWVANYRCAYPMTCQPWPPFAWSIWQYLVPPQGNYYGLGSVSIDLDVTNPTNPNPLPKIP